MAVRPVLGEMKIPVSLEAEAAVLGCMLVDPVSSVDLVLSKLEKPEAMYDPAHCAVFKAIKQIRERSESPEQVDIVTVAGELERQGKLEDVGGREFLMELYNCVPSAANLENYINAVLDAYLLRRMIHSCESIAERCRTNEEAVDTVIDQIEKEILDITRMRTDFSVQSLAQVLPDAFDYLHKLHTSDPAIRGLRSGFAPLDDLITGLRPGEMIVLAARPSIGKTTLAMNILRNVCVLNDVPVGFFSLEMDAKQVVVRLICSEAQINLSELRDGKLSTAEWNTRLMSACDRLHNMKIFIDSTPQLSSMELRQKCRRMVYEHGVKAVAIDYLQLMRPSSSGKGRESSREQEVAKMSSDIKAMARELEIPVIVLAQLNRAAESADKPKISNLRESGAIEQDADIVALLHRERETDSEEAERNVQEGRGIESKLIIAKNRNGPTGVVDLIFFPQYTLFDVPERIREEDVPV